MVNLPYLTTHDIGGDEIGMAAMNVYGQPPHAQHVYLPSYYQGQMTYTSKFKSSLCLVHSLVAPSSTPLYLPSTFISLVFRILIIYDSSLRSLTRSLSQSLM